MLNYSDRQHGKIQATKKPQRIKLGLVVWGRVTLFIVDYITDSRDDGNHDNSSEYR
jgi:hypothetical protein